ncbi:Uncharacterized protein TCM_020806 [Theobroma cacao]|uniref:Uncharacterized protein n=1 Tax=Theobroma cacao TaxID=3641 RepID=A0A061EMQ7_THECC|nr:Uncharacterized protein TCM_020806 [Theobroma cacao]
MRLLNIALVALVLLLLLQVHASSASRLLHQETKLGSKGLGLQSLQKGPVPPSQGSSCTNIPAGTGEVDCPLKEKHYAGGALPRATAYPRLMVQFAVATDQK